MAEHNKVLSSIFFVHWYHEYNLLSCIQNIYLSLAIVSSVILSRFWSFFSHVCYLFSLSHSLSRSLTLCVCLSLSLSPSVPLSQSQSLALSISLHYFVSLSLYLFLVSEYMERHSVSRLIGSPPG